MPAPMQGPLGQYGIARSLVQTPGWNPLEAEEGGMMPAGGGGGGGMSFRMGGGGSSADVLEGYGYKGEWSPNQTNIAPSVRGVTGTRPNSDIAYASAVANWKSGLYPTLDAALQAQVNLMNKIPQYSIAENQRLVDASQKMMGSNASQAAAKLAHERATVKNTQGQTVNDQLRASRGVFNQAPKVGDWSPGGTVKAKAPLAINQRTGRTYSSFGGW